MLSETESGTSPARFQVFHNETKKDAEQDFAAYGAIRAAAENDVGFTDNHLSFSPYRKTSVYRFRGETSLLHVISDLDVIEPQLILPLDNNIHRFC